MKKIIENRANLATKQQVINTSTILRDFLQEKGVAANDIYKFLRKKKLSVLGLEKAKNQFINYSIYGKETELVKEFFEENKENE
jgi:hypothetical protein